MGKKATKTLDNMYYKARMDAAERNEDFSSREKAAEILGIDRTRLARIELETIFPYPEEVVLMWTASPLEYWALSKILMFYASLSSLLAKTAS